VNILNFLKKYTEKKIYYKPNPGNGGDALIAAGAFKIFKQLNLDVEIIKGTNYDHLKNKIVLYAGGGNLVNEYTNCANFIQANKDKVEELIILPHTVNGHKELLSSLDERVTLFCREEYSYNKLKSENLKINIFLDHDLAFYLDPIDFSARSGPTISKRLYATQMLKKMIFSKDRKTLMAFRVDAEKTLIEIPKDNIDVSNAINHVVAMYPESMVHKTVQDLFQFLNYFDTIKTNRLHIAIAGALLKKEVFMYSNSYYKNKAIFEFSLKGKYKNVVFYDK